MPGGWPGLAFEDHEIVVWPDGAGRGAVEGESLALPAALAFLALWTGQPVAGDLAATGRLLVRARVPVHPVASAAQKAAALAEAAAGGDAPPRLLGAAGQGLARADVVVVEVEDFAAAVAAAGLDVAAAAPARDLGDIATRRKRLENLVVDVQAQQLDRFRACAPGVDPWLALAHELRLLVDSLAQGSGETRERLDRARAHAALAYTHAGALDDAEALLRDVDITAETPPPVTVLWHLVRIGQLIDESNWEEAHRLSAELDGWLERLTADQAAELRGRARGTQGRLLLHQRRTADALPLLVEALEHHRERAPHEAGRSRVYVAMARRMSGDLEGAAQELERARDELRRHTRSYSEPYERTCLLYWRYERARLAVDAGDLAVAESVAREALADTSWRGSWPALGIQRTLAWALRGLGRDAEADEVVAAMRVASAGWGFGERIVVEAEGPARRDGEVY
jgi:hypothetical protein